MLARRAQSRVLGGGGGGVFRVRARPCPRCSHLARRLYATRRSSSSRDRIQTVSAHRNVSAHLVVSAHYTVSALPVGSRRISTLRHESSARHVHTDAALLERSLARCPDHPKPRILPCSSCTKAFASNRALEHHWKRCDPGGSSSSADGTPLSDAALNLDVSYSHPSFDASTQTSLNLDVSSKGGASAQRFSCPECKTRFESASILRRHMARHTRRPVVRCDVCGDEFKSTQSLRAHVERNPGHHESHRAPVLGLDTTHLSTQYFSHPIDVVENRWIHISSEEKQSEIRSANFLRAGRPSDRFHDGELRADSAPPCAFGLVSTSDAKIPTASFHPVFAEPGELTSTLTMDLAMFVANPGEYKLYLASLSPTGYKKAAGGYRLTLLMAREPDWAWASEHLLELPLFDNPIFSCTRNSEAQQSNTDATPSNSDGEPSTIDPAPSNVDVEPSNKANLSTRETSTPIGFPGGTRPPPKHKRPVFMSFKDLQLQSASSNHVSVSSDSATVSTKQRSDDEQDKRRMSPKPPSSKSQDGSAGEDAVWRCASRFHPNGDGVSAHIAAIVIGVANGASLAGASPVWFDSVKMGKIDGALHCPDCDGEMDSYKHLFSHRLGTMRPKSRGTASPVDPPASEANGDEEVHGAYPDEYLEPERVLDQSCHIFTTVESQAAIESSGVLKGVLVQSTDDATQRLESAFAPLPSSEGQIFPFSTLPHTAKNGATTALLTMNMGFLTNLLSAGERKLFCRPSEVRNHNFFRYYTTHVVVASADHWKALEESDFEEIDFRDEISNPVLRLNSDNEWIVSTRIREHDTGQARQLRVLISFADDIQLSKVEHSWRESSKLQTSFYGGKRGYLCPISSCTVTNLQSLARVKEHFRATHSSEGSSLICEEDGCAFEATTTDGLRQHHRVKHGGQRFQCGFDGCDFSSAYKSVLSRHALIEHEAQRYSCTEADCTFSALSKQAVATHVAAKHDGISHSCVVCDFTTRYKKNIKSHMRTRHKGWCEICGFEGDDALELKSHALSRHPDSFWFCEVDLCDFSTSNKASLQRHAVRKHETPWVSCSQCNFSTITKRHLRIHIRQAHDSDSIALPKPLVDAIQPKAMRMQA